MWSNSGRPLNPCITESSSSSLSVQGKERAFLADLIVSVGFAQCASDRAEGKEGKHNREPADQWSNGD